MRDEKTVLFWDSNVFIAYLRNDQSSYDIPSIETYLKEAKEGSTLIYASSLTLAEILPRKIGTGSFSNFSEFTADFEGSVVLLDPNPNIMTLAGQLRDLPYKKGQSTKRLARKELSDFSPL